MRIPGVSAASAAATPAFSGRRKNSLDAVICAALTIALLFLACRIASIW
ncbi:MAG TPA: hypothetical protein VFK01_14980 [Bradyrhizobium sp.]|nr:hypothetical protein [Bradyrhizobium sp.]